MNTQEIKANAIRFLGLMMSRPEILAEVQDCADSTSATGKDAAAVAAVMAKHLSIPQPTNDEVRAMAAHIQETTAQVRDSLAEHAPAQAEQFSPARFYIG